MACMTHYLENKVLDHVLRGVTYTPPATLYVAAFTVAPTDAGGGTEVSGGGYVRKSVVAGDWNAASGGLITNLNEILFATATGSWGSPVVALGIFDASTSGNLLIWGTPTLAKSFTTDDVLRVAAAALTIDCD